MRKQTKETINNSYYTIDSTYGRYKLLLLGLKHEILLADHDELKVIINYLDIQGLLFKVLRQKRTLGVLVLQILYSHNKASG